MTTAKSGALVFFGATGDLAHKKIFPALQALIRSGSLDMPIIGMARADWTLGKLRERARDNGPALSGRSLVTAAQRSRRTTYSPLHDGGLQIFDVDDGQCALLTMPAIGRSSIGCCGCSCYRGSLWLTDGFRIGHGQRLRASIISVKYRSPQ